MSDEPRDADDSGTDDYRRKAMVLSLTYFVGIFVFSVWQIFNYGKNGDLFESTKLNSLGDFLAGVFAPIAFIWVAVAVFIQSKELAAQRMELALTRKEFAENRLVMKEQANAAKAQVEAADDQVALARASADANWKLSLFDNRIKIYNELIDISRDLASAGPIDNDLMVKIGNLANRMKFVFSLEFQSWVKEIQDDIDTAILREVEWRHFGKLVKDAEHLTADTESMKNAYRSMIAFQEDIKIKLSKKEIENRFDYYLILPHIIEPLGYTKTR